MMRISAADRTVALLVAVYILLLLMLPLMLPAAEVRALFLEEGPFERLSIVAWLLTALIIVVRIRPLGPRAWAFVGLCVTFAAREADLHKAYTADSILKTNYYKHAVAPAGEKLVAGMVALVGVALVLYAGFVILRFLFRSGGWRSRAGFWLLFGTAGVVFGKLLDRAPAVLAEDYGIVLPALGQLYTAAFEEGLEMLHPLILGWSIWISQKERRYLS